MAFYAWTATDTAGKTQRGTLQAEGQKQVRQMLREQKLMPVSITETREAATAGKAKTGAKLSTPVLSMFTRQLSTLVNAALPLESALKAISKQTEDKKLAAMVVEIREKVVEGHTLFDAFSQFPRTFDKLYCTLVMAGEKTGHLGDVLEKLAEYNEQRQKMKSKLTQAMVYPITLTVVAIAVISILLVAVVPQVIEQFTHMKQQLPITTRTLIAVSDFLQAWGIYIVGILGGGFIGFKTWLRNAKNRFRWHSWLVNGSPIKKLVCAINSARYIRTLSILQASSVPLLEGMYIAMDGIENLYARQVLGQAADTVRQGASLYAALEQAKLFPPTMLYMIASGEESGELGNLMDRAAENQESALQHRITLTLSVFEPALVVSMATIVLFIVLSILQPLLQLNNMVGSIMALKRKNLARQAGFTLLELMVVIVILGVLASMVVPNLMGNKEKADEQKATSDIVALEGSLDMYKLDNHRYPTTEQGLQALVTKPEIAPIPNGYRADGYIRRLPQDPWGGDYILVSPGEHGAVDVFSAGPDGEANTADDITNWSLDKKEK